MQNGHDLDSICHPVDFGTVQPALGGRHSTSIALIALGFEKGSHISHYLIVRDIRAWIIERRLHFGTEPTVVAGGLLFGFKL
jgi:hypothetical protein